MSVSEEQKDKIKIKSKNEARAMAGKAPLMSDTVMVEQVVEIDPSTACLWKFKDRQAFELGDLEQFAEDLKVQGQAVPVIARLSQDNKEYQYEIIAGERRWRAAILANLKLKVILRILDDKEAFITQTIENTNRRSISDYSMGLTYQKLIDNNVITTKEIQEKLHIERTAVSNLLSFSKVPVRIWLKVGDMSKVTARTSAQIRALTNKGDAYIDALIQVAPEIREGAGARRVRQLVDDILTSNRQRNAPQKLEKIISNKGQHLFTWLNEDDNIIHFPEPIRRQIDFDKLKIILKNEIEKLLGE